MRYLGDFDVDPETRNARAAAAARHDALRRRGRVAAHGIARTRMAQVAALHLAKARPLKPRLHAF
jgi:hypothetical protein